MKIILGVADLSIKIWEIVRPVAVMVNNLVLKKRHIETLENIKKHHNIEIWVDSGGYQIMVRRLNTSLEYVASRYRTINADYFMSLDIPVFLPFINHRDIVEKNIRNYRMLRKLLPEHNIIPVIHMYDPDLLIYATDKYLEDNPGIVAYGGIVPPMLRKTRLRLASILGFLILKKLLPRTRIHVLGVGSYLMVRLFEKLGAWSLDTSTWRVKAAYGHVIIPGLGERYVGNRRLNFGTPKAKDNELEILYQYLEKTRFPHLDKFDLMLKTFRGRAIINAWVIMYINDGINPRSSFLHLYRKALRYKDYSLEELTKEYRKVIQDAKEKYHV